MRDNANSNTADALDVPRVRVSDHPQLKIIAWGLRPGIEISERDTLRLYKRNWRHVGDFGDREAAFVQHRADVYSRGRLLV